MTTKRSSPADVSLSAREKALLTKVERSKLEIAETEAEMANFLSQRKQLDAEIMQAVGIELSKLRFSRNVVADEIEGSKILLAEARVALQQATAQLDALHSQREMVPVVGGAVARWGGALAELLQAGDELIQALAQADQAGWRIPCQRLLPGGGAGLIQNRADLGLPRGLLALAMDESGVLSARHVVTVLAARHDLVQEVAA